MKDSEFKANCEKMQTYADISDAITYTRIKLDLSRGELSKLSGVRVANIRKYEQMDKCPDIPTLMRLAESMDCTVRIRFEPKEEQSIG